MRVSGRSGFGTAAQYAPIGGDGGAGLDLLSGGTFTRSTEGSYLTGAATDGSTAFLAWAGVNARRIENRGDSNGSMLLMEGSRQATLLQSEAFGTTWVAGGAASVTSNNNAGPDGASTADTIVFTASASDVVSQISSVVPADAARGVFTIWLRAAAAQTVRLRMLQKDGVTFGADVSCSVTTTWQRFELNQAVGTGVVAPTLGVWNHTDAAARNVFATGGMFECSATAVQSPSSTVRTTATAVTRGADVLSYAVGQYPASFLMRGFRFTFAPDLTHTEQIATGSDLRLWGVTSGTNLVQFGSGVSILRLFCAAGIVAASGALTWSRGQLLTITAEPLAGRLTVAGATTGNGTFSGVGVAWPSSAFVWSASATAFGRSGVRVEAL